MSLYSYVIARDYGFAPNPFHGYCTLATCKPVVRRVAQIGDWVIGTGSARYQRSGQLISAMCVSETMTYDEYWADPRFLLKRPDLTGSNMMAFGDNIYRHGPNSAWIQLDSHHSLPEGGQNLVNLRDDTQTDRILVAAEYSYFGAAAPTIPAQFRGEGPSDICALRGHKNNFAGGLAEAFIDWVRELPSGYIGRPDRWP